MNISLEWSDNNFAQAVTSLSSGFFLDQFLSYLPFIKIIIPGVPLSLFIYTKSFSSHDSLILNIVTSRKYPTTKAIYNCSTSSKNGSFSSWEKLGFYTISNNIRYLRFLSKNLIFTEIFYYSGYSRFYLLLSSSSACLLHCIN